MSRKALDAIEWSLIREALASRTRSGLGQTLAADHGPFETRAESERLRVRVAEARLLIERSPLHGYLADAADPSELLERASREGVLAPTELWLCGHFLGTVGLVGEELRARKDSAPHWASDYELAPKTPPICALIQRSVSSEGLILDSASADLARLRRERVAKRASFESSLDSKIKDWHSQGFLQDRFYDVLDGRYVVPVKVEQQSKLEGALFGKSNTGQSVFIEPRELLESNNALKEIDLEIHQEERRILRSLSREVGKLSSKFAPWVPVLAELDLALAAGVLAKDWDLSLPVVPATDARQTPIALKDFFHPALKEQRIDIVKNSLSIPTGGYGLLISGPNTGGKTVLLKATALCAAMAAAGLFIPAAEGSIVPHYANVLAFIGDEQNLAQGLSSFSGQILDMRAVLSETRSPLLIVIDEMLSSTDPEEASALAQTLIEEFVSHGHHVLVTSHFSELSLRCKQLPQMAVAAMEFDNGRPTYRMREHEMGASHALEVAERLGFPQKLLARARSLLSTAKLDYERAQAQLKEKERRLEQEYDRKLIELHDKLDRERASFQKDLQAGVEAFMAKSQAKLDETIEALNRRITTYTRQGIGTPSSKIESLAEAARGDLQEEASRIKNQIKGVAQPTAAEPLAVGSPVKIRSMSGAKGEILELLPGDRAIVQMGNFRLERALADLERAGSIPKQKQRSSYVGTDLTASRPDSSRLDLRGRRFDEAINEAEHFIDAAFRSGFPSVTVITGHGTGALKKGLKDLLKGLPYVKEFKPERTNDDGATLIEFDR